MAAWSRPDGIERAERNSDMETRIMDFPDYLADLIDKYRHAQCDYRKALEVADHNVSDETLLMWCVIEATQGKQHEANAAVGRWLQIVADNGDTYAAGQPRASDKAIAGRLLAAGGWNEDGNRCGHEGGLTTVQVAEYADAAFLNQDPTEPWTTYEIGERINGAFVVATLVREWVMLDGTVWAEFEVEPCDSDDDRETFDNPDLSDADMLRKKHLGIAANDATL